jgi:hypothetical protein
MLKQEDLAFLKAISAARQSPALPRELTKALSASKEKRAVAVRKASELAKAPTRREDTKRKASQLGLDSTGEPALCAPVIVFELWPRIGRRDTAEKQSRLQEQRALAY